MPLVAGLLGTDGLHGVDVRLRGGLLLQAPQRSERRCGLLRALRDQHELLQRGHAEPGRGLEIA